MKMSLAYNVHKILDRTAQSPDLNLTKHLREHLDRKITTPYVRKTNY